MLVSPSVFWQQTTQKVEASKSQQITAMKWWNDTAILANNGPTTTTPATKPKRNFDEEWDDKKLEQAQKDIETAKQNAQKDIETAKQEAEKAKKLAELSKTVLPK